MVRTNSTKLFVAGALLLLGAGALVLFPNDDRTPAMGDAPVTQAPREHPPKHAMPPAVAAPFVRATTNISPIAPPKSTRQEATTPVFDTTVPGKNDEASATPAIPTNDFDDEANDDLVERLAEERGEARTAAWERAEREGWPTHIQTNDTVQELMDIDPESGPLYYTTHNINAGISSAANLVRTAPYNLSGTNILVGVWDGSSARATHQEFGGRVTVQNPSLPQNHATHVAGTIGAAGIDSAAIGMAPAVLIDSYSWTNDVSEMASRGMEFPGQAGRLQLSNHSYGYIAGWASGGWSGNSGPHWFGTWGAQESDSFGLYDASARTWDEITYDAPYYLPFKSAGNDRNNSAPSTGATFYYWSGSWQSGTYDPDVHPHHDYWKQGGYDTIPRNGVAKNAMLVGAVNDAVTSGLRNTGAATMSSFSAWGPSDDGRIKPDIVANGVSLRSTGASSDTHYYNSSGTSMSSPSAAGSAALLLEQYAALFPGQYMRSSTIRALIIHTADSLDDPGPDFRNGWGLMNTQAAVDHLLLHALRPNAYHLVEDFVSTTNAIAEYEITWNNTDPLRVTIAWTDPPGPMLSGLNNTNLTLINDLDLRVIDPTGTTNFPWILDPSDFPAPATTGDNFRDNVEQVYIDAPPTSGVYTVRISHKGSLEDNIQYFSLIVSGSAEPLTIEHTPVDDTADLINPYPIPASITPTQLVDLVETELFWTLDGDTNTLTAVPFTWLTNSTYEAEIPPQSLGDEIHYYIRAVSTEGLVTTDPPDAPASMHIFQVVPPLYLTVTGTPFEAGTVDPAYGVNPFASGVVVQAGAEMFTTPTNGQRQRVDGWIGAGSVPASGDSNAVSFTITEDSSLDWQWEQQYALTQTSSVAGIVDTITWADTNTFVDTSLAPWMETVGATNCRFAEWRVDDARQANTNTGVASNPATDIELFAPRDAVAVYFPEDQDTDGEGLPDWWQIYYFGALGVDPDADDDGDGASNLAEFLDGTDPTDDSSFPTPPQIDHTPLTTPQAGPAPWSVSAAITDNDAVATAILWWNRNASGWDSVALFESDTPDIYTNAIPEPGVTGDTFEYYITAADNLGLITTNGPHTVDVSYAVMDVTPDTEQTFLLQPGTTTNFTLAVTNNGHAVLNWTMLVDAPRFFDDMEDGEGDWSSFGSNDQWHISTNRSWSGDHAWYNGIEGTSGYQANMFAFLEIMPLTLNDGSNPTLTFRHWIEAEEASETTAYHGGLVGISTDDGENYFLIHPVGGYPFTLVGSDLSVYSGSNDWDEAVFDLTAYAGQTVLLAFVFVSDGIYAGHEGWYIDDVAVGPLEHFGGWLTPTNETGSLASMEGTNWTMTVSAEDAPTGSEYGLLIRVTGNDPVSNERLLPVQMQVRTPATVNLISAEQAATNGTGHVTIVADLFNPAPETLDVELLFSTDNGDTWDDAWIQNALATYGSLVLTNPGAPQLLEIDVINGENNDTNQLNITWSTTNTPSVLLSTGTLIRVRAWDGFFWSDPAFSAPFLVDNEPPAAVAGLISTTHTTEVWSANDTFIGEWETGNDGDGIGIAGYSYMLNVTLITPPPTVSTTNTTINYSGLPDATNWWLAVRAIDAFGNAGPTTSIGPFYIDATPPTSDTAVIDIATSAYGDYTLSDILTNTWSGFADNLSGVAGFYIALTNGNGTTNGAWSATTNAVLPDAAFDQTNTVYVWAQDEAGNIGDAASATILVLHPDTLWDGSGMTAGDKEIAGLDATDPDAVFEGEPVQDPETPNTLILRWPYADGRLYTIHWSEDTLDENFTWTVVNNPDYTADNGVATWTDPNPLNGPNGRRIYRVEVQLDDD